MYYIVYGWTKIGAWEEYLCRCSTNWIMRIDIAGVSSLQRQSVWKPGRIISLYERQTIFSSQHTNICVSTYALAIRIGKRREWHLSRMRSVIPLVNGWFSVYRTAGVRASLPSYILLTQNQHTCLSKYDIHVSHICVYLCAYLYLWLAISKHTEMSLRKEHASPNWPTVEMRNQHTRTWKPERLRLWPAKIPRNIAALYQAVMSRHF